MEFEKWITQLAAEDPKERESAVRALVKDYIEDGKYLDELLGGLASFCESIDRKATNSLAQEFHFYWSPGHFGDENIYRVFTALERIASVKPVVQEPRVMGDILEGWIVWERFPNNEWTAARAELAGLTQSKRVSGSRLASGPSGWAIFADRGVAQEVCALLRRAGATPSPPSKVRCFTSRTDPRIPTSSVRAMETGHVIEEIEGA